MGNMNKKKTRRWGRWGEKKRSRKGTEARAKRI